MCECVCVCVCIYHSFFIHSLIDGHLGWFHMFANVNSAAMNMHAKVLFCVCNDLFLLGGYPVVELLDGMVVLLLVP